METHTTICKIESRVGICWMTQGASTGTPSQPRGLGWGGRWKGIHEEGYVYIHPADSC